MSTTKEKAEVRARVAKHRQKLKTYQEWKAHLLAQWAEHNTFHVEKQEDGGFRIKLEHSTEGDRITAEIAKHCGLDPDTVIQKMVGEVLTELGGKWIPTKLKGG